MKLALGCVQSIEHRVRCGKDHVTVYHRVGDRLVIAVVNLDLALLGLETSWHGLSSGVIYHNSHLITERVCGWQGYL